MVIVVDSYGIVVDIALLVEKTVIVVQTTEFLIEPLRYPKAFLTLVVI